MGVPHRRSTSRSSCSLHLLFRLRYIKGYRFHPSRKTQTYHLTKKESHKKLKHFFKILVRFLLTSERQLYEKKQVLKNQLIKKFLIFNTSKRLINMSTPKQYTYTLGTHNNQKVIFSAFERNFELV